MENPDSYFEIAELTGKFLEGKLSKQEAEKLRLWISEDEEHQRIWEKMIDRTHLEKQLRYWKDGDTKKHWNALNARLFHKPPVVLTVLRKTMRYAAVVIPILLILGVGWYLIGQQREQKYPIAQTTLNGIHILPKGRVARLVLGNGKVIQLKDSLQKVVTEKDGTKVSNHGSTLRYLSDRKEDNNRIIYNTLHTPRGGEYQIVLADGTKVWLNAASSLRFPTQFSGRERKVYLSGEAYFEIAKDARHPFIVKAGKMDITVLGTKFNVSAYQGDKQQTATLAAGAIRVGTRRANTKDDEGVVLQPGYEATITGENNHIDVNKANVKAALAWTKGLFIFDSETLGQIMRTLSRWYDVDVQYTKGIDTTLHFTGRIQKYGNITGILKKLELTKKIQFNIQGHKVSVVPYNNKG